MRVVTLASGSSGNAIYIGSDHTHILVDAGISNKKIEERLNEIGVDMRDLSGICVTHEHLDHIRGLSVLAKKYQIPIYSTEGTIQVIKAMGKMREDTEWINVKKDQTFMLGDLCICPFSIAHDAVDPVAYRVSCQDKHVAVATDLGYFDEYTVKNLQGLDVAIIESNHDVRMLECGRYPYSIKRRILGNRGHLSNENGGKLINQILHSGMKHIFLGHLSKENNLPEIAFATVQEEINVGEGPYRGSDFPIEVAKRDAISSVVEF